MPLDSDTLQHLILTTRRFVQERLIPLEKDVEEKDELPANVVQEMRELGLFGLSIPEAYGGLGLSMFEEVLVAFEVGRTSPAFRSIFGTNVGIGSQGILIDGTDAQKEQYLPQLASGELISSFALTEPDFGSDAANLQTRADKKGNVYVLNGTKRYITNAQRAGIFTVMARTGTHEEKGRGITAFIVNADSTGLTLGKKDKKMGQRGTTTCDVIFDNVEVPSENIIGGIEGQGFKTAMKVLDRGRLHMGATSVGMARRLIQESLDYATSRKQFGSKIADFQLIQAMLADSQVETYAGECMVEKTAKRYDAGENVSMEASICKLHCTEMVGRVADRAVQIHGGAGYIAEYPVERFYRDVRLLRLYEGTSQIQQLVIAKNMIRGVRQS